MTHLFESETVNTGRTDFKDGDRVWVDNADHTGTITFAGGKAALVLMDSGHTCRASYANLSRLIPPTHTGVPDDSASAPEAHTGSLDVACEYCGAKPGERCVNKYTAAFRTPHPSRRSQTLESDPYAGLGDCGMDFSQTSGSEYAELLKRSQTSWPAKTSGVDLDPACPHGYLHRSNCERCPETPEPKPIVDMVNSPPHYQANPAGIEVIQITEHLNFCLGNAVKYILRADHKGDAEKDLRKAIWYLERELQRRAVPASVEVTPDEEEQAK